MNSSLTRETTYAVVVGQILAQERADRGFSQTSLAAKLGAIQSVISRIETGVLPLGVDMLARWSAILQIPPSHVLSAAEDAVAVLGAHNVTVVFRRAIKLDDVGAAAVGALLPHPAMTVSGRGPRRKTRK